MATSTATKHYTLEEIIDLKNDGAALVKDFKPQYAMLFTDPTSNEVVEVWPTDVQVTIGHKIDGKVVATTTEIDENNKITIKDGDGNVLDANTAVPYYEVLLNVLENTGYPNRVKLSKGYVFRKQCISKPGCHFDWAQVCCTNISKLDGGS